MTHIATRYVYISASDGKRVTIDPKTKRKEDNSPTKEQLTKTKGENGQWTWYQELDFKDKRHYDWRKKLGGLLIETMADNIKKRKLDLKVPAADKFLLAAFPENYRLYEHRRVANPDNPEERGAGDRSDVYLYGYPQGRKKRFRSPNDFFHHMYWLATSEDCKNENCQCKFCASDEAQKAFFEIQKYQQDTLAIKAEEAKPTVQSEQQAPQKVEKPNGTTQKASTPSFMVEIPKRTIPAAIQNPTPQPAQSPAPTPIAPPVASPIANPSPPVQATNQEQALDATPNKFMFRPGEVVWYQRSPERGGAVGLAAVVARDLVDNGGKKRAAYNVQPLSHPFNHAPTVIVRDEHNLKPWLAFSPPENFHDSLRKINVAYEQIPWQDILNGRYGEGDTEADGSIFAAKTVDASYTPFEVIAQSAAEIKYNGIYLGGEKIWRGEALRLRQGAGKDIMILVEIVEKPVASAADAQVSNLEEDPPATTELTFVGDIYSYRSAPNPSRQMPTNTYLPLRLQHDLAFRNAASMAKQKGSCYWKFIRPSARLGLSEVKGRWYESKNMIPILNSPDVLREQVNEGRVQDIGDSLNSHGDSAAIVPEGLRRKKTRLDAFGMAVPKGTVFMERREQRGQAQGSSQVQQRQQQQQGVQNSHPIPQGQMMQQQQQLSLQQRQAQGYEAMLAKQREQQVAQQRQQQQQQQEEDHEQEEEDEQEDTEMPDFVVTERQSNRGYQQDYSTG